MARRLGTASIATASLCRGAFMRAIESGVFACDTLFGELAARTARPLLTFDKTVPKAFPEVARRRRDRVGRRFGL